MNRGQDLILNGEIILTGMVMSDEELAYRDELDGMFTPQMVREALQEFTGAVTLRLNSTGGYVYAGEAIRSMLAGHPGGVKIIVEGFAASAASLIFMAGQPRVMSEGSILMIHDPTNISLGTEADMLRDAAVLGYTADTYAAVYATAAGISTEDARAIMRAETWYNAADAIAAGFADEVLALPAAAARMSVDGARFAFATMRQGLAKRLARKNSGAQSASGPSAAAGGFSAAMATSEEAVMPDIVLPAATVATLAPVMAAVTVSPQTTAAEIVMAERQRQRDIRMMAAPFLASTALVAADVEALIDNGTSAADAGQRFMTTMAATQPTIRRPGAVITRDEVDTKLEAIIGAMMGQTDGASAEFRGIKLKSLATYLAGPKYGFDTMAAVRAGMSSTAMMNGAIGVSDFAYITSSVLNRTLRDEYIRRAPVWQSVAGKPMIAGDFQELLSVRFGGDFQLKNVLENGEYQHSTLADEAEGLRVVRRGRTIKLTFELVVGDKLDALKDIPLEFARAARQMENSMVWSLIRSNAVLKSDSLALYHTTHKNLAAVPAIISAASFGIARKAMWEQRALGVKDADDFLDITPDRLIVPPALEVAALSFVTSTSPATDGTVNPYKSTVQVIVVPNLGVAAGGSDTAWYLVSSDIPPVSVAYLEGYEAPTVETTDGLNPDVVTMNARHIFGAANTEYRGTFKNNGL